MLWKKMLRDLREHKGAYFACMVIMIIGIMVFTTFNLVLDNLKLSQASFYTSQNFADGFIKVKALPFNEVRKIDGIEGIAQIQGRMVQDVQVFSPENKENVYLRLISVDPLVENSLNEMLLTEGISLNPGEMNIWVDNKFFQANNLKLNEQIEIIADGKKVNLTIVGVGKSPEFIYALRNAADIYPSPETFGIAFIPLDIMKTLFKEQAFNDLVFSLEPGINYDDIKYDLEDKLKPFGLISFIPRKDQVSHLLLTQEIQGLEAMAQAMPMMFLAIAAMILYITLKRLIEQQRGQIGILKAFGYTQNEIIRHYLSYPFIISLLGSSLGGLLGIIFASPMTAFYLTFFNMPELSGNFSFKYFIIGIILSLFFSLFAGYQGCKKILTLEPAEAMRPSAPIIGKKVLLEKFAFIWNMLTVQGMMAIRNISRNKGRSIFIVLGIMFCFGISGFTWSMNDLIQKMLFDQYEKVEVYDVKITLTKPLDSHKVTRELLALPEILSAEPLAEIPVTLKNEWIKKDVAIVGIPADSILYNILDKNGQKIKPPKEGILLSERLASVLSAQTGTKLSMETVLLPDWETEEKLEVVGIIPQYVGINAYMDINSLQEFLGEGALTTALMLKTENRSDAFLKEKYRHSTLVAGIEEKRESLKKLQEMMASYGSLIYIFALLGVIIGFAIIYSSSIITLSERSRELASMMVLGMTPEEVLSVVTFEQWVLGVGAMLLGVPTAKLMFVAIAQSVNNDIFTMPAEMSVTAYFLAFLVTGFSIWIAQKTAARKISNLSLVEVLKARE
ncbi:MAG: ABC transporter permease [Peptococcales bacterium]|jgi:putative ABC transport system permease protein